MAKKIYFSLVKTVLFKLSDALIKRNAPKQRIKVVSELEREIKFYLQLLRESSFTKDEITYIKGELAGMARGTNFEAHAKDLRFVARRLKQQ